MPRIALYVDQLDTKPVSLPARWETLVELLCSSEASPCTLETCTGKGKGKDKGCPYKSRSAEPRDNDGNPNPMAWSPVEIVGKRLDANVRALTVLVLDFDHLDDASAQAVREHLAGREHVWHTTHSHRTGDHCFRVALALSRDVKAGEWHRFLRTAVVHLGVSVQNREGDVQPDPVCKDRARLYYRPSHPKDAPYEAQHVTGVPLDVDAVLALPDPLGDEPPPLPHEAVRPIVDSAGAWDLAGEHIEAAIDSVATYFPERGRNAFCLALAGMLRNHGASEDDARHIVYEIALRGGSTEPHKRAQTVAHTYRLGEEAAMTGFTRVIEILNDCDVDGEAVAKEFGDYLTDARNEAFLKGVSKNGSNGSANGKNGHSHHDAFEEAPPLPDEALQVVDLAELRTAISKFASNRARGERDDRVLAKLLRRALAGEPIGLDLDPETGLNAEEALTRAVRAIASALPLDTPWDAVATLLQQSLGAHRVLTDVDYTDFAKKKWKSAVMARATREEKRKREEEVRVERARILETAENWQDDLLKGRDGSTLSVPANAGLILRNDPDIKGCFRWNRHHKQLEIHGGVLARFAAHGPEVFVTELRNWLSRRYEIHLNDREARFQVMSIAHDYAYDPLADYLSSLKRDDESRINTFLTRYFGAADTAHNQRIGRLWLIGSVARAFEPGCKFDNVLVFEHIQGARKSSAFEALGGDFFTSTEINVRDKDAKMLASACWIVELAELDSIRRSESTIVKAFLTTRKDTFRPPFGAAVLTAPRRCVFVGTTNEERYLTDDTGNRRYWPVRCGTIDVPGLLRDHAAIWAEAVELYLAYRDCPACAESTDTVHGQEPRCYLHRWWLDKEEEKVAKEEVESRVEDKPSMVWQSKILSWWKDILPAQRPRSITIADVALSLDKNADPSRISQATLQAIGLAMRGIGFVRENKQRTYVATQGLLELPHVKGRPF